MTREEMENIKKENAIKDLKELQIDIGSSPDDLEQSPLYYALDMAIKALEQPFINKPCISEGVCREDKMQTLDKIRAELIQSIQNGTLKIESGNEELFRIINEYKEKNKENRK